MPDFTSFSVSVSGFLTGTGAKTTPTPISDPGGPPKPHFHPRISLIHGWPKSHPSLDLSFFFSGIGALVQTKPVRGAPCAPPGEREHRDSSQGAPRMGVGPGAKNRNNGNQMASGYASVSVSVHRCLRENRNRNRKNHKNPETGFVPLFRPAHPKPEPRIEAPNPLVFGFGFGSTLRLP